MAKVSTIKIITLLLVALINSESTAQGKTTLVDGHQLAGVNVTSGKSGTIPLKYAVFIPTVGHYNAIPGHNAAYSEGDLVIESIMSEAVLAIDWWVLFGEPVENYLFTWKARDYYQINLPDPAGGTRVHKLIKTNLNKYPDLLARFEALKPTEIEFEIEWNIGDTDFYYETEKTFGDMYGTRNRFKTKVLSSSILIETSGKTPFSVPGIRQGKGEEFLGLDKDFPKDKLKLIMQQFAKSNSHYIHDVKVTKIKWPMGEMKAIAELYDAYEKGEVDPTPLQQIENELKKSQNLTAYNSNDFWGEAFEELNTNLIEFNQEGKVGFKNEKGKIAIPPIFKWATFISKHKIIIAEEFDKEPGLYTPTGVLRLNLKDYRDHKILEETDFALILTYSTGFYVNLKTAEIVFNLPLHGGNYSNAKKKSIPVNKYNYEIYQSGAKYDNVCPSLDDMTSQGIIPSTVYYVMGDFIKKNSGGWTVRKVHFYGVTKSQEIKLFYTGQLRFGF